MPAPDNDPANIHNHYDDPTGVPSPLSNEAMHRGYSPLTTDTPGQHVHNTAGTPETAGKTIVEDDDLYIDTTPA